MNTTHDGPHPINTAPFNYRAYTKLAWILPSSDLTSILFRPIPTLGRGCNPHKPPPSFPLCRARECCAIYFRQWPQTHARKSSVRTTSFPFPPSEDPPRSCGAWGGATRMDSMEWLPCYSVGIPLGSPRRDSVPRCENAPMGRQRQTGYFCTTHSACNSVRPMHATSVTFNEPQ